MQFFNWWYNWGVFLFLLLDLVAIFWIILDSANRRINALAWRMGAIVPVLLILPSFFLKFSSSDAQKSMQDLWEPFFWVGLIGAVIPIVLAIVYALTAASRPAGGLAQPPQPYPPQPYPPPPYPPQPMPPQPMPPTQGYAPPPRPPRPKANGWLYVQSGPAAGRSFQLNAGDTRIGRSSDSDIALNDAEVSKGHALIREQGGQFTIQDLGSTNGTFVNNQRLNAVQMLYDGDIVRIGQTTLVFKHAG